MNLGRGNYLVLILVVFLELDEGEDGLFGFWGADYKGN